MMIPLRWLFAALLLCAMASADLLTNGDDVEPGYPFGKHCTLTREQEQAIQQDSLNHFKANQKGYCFEAFPHSRVPTSFCFVVILTVGVAVLFLFVAMVMPLFYALPIFRGTTEMRKSAHSQLRVVGFMMDKKDLAPPEDPENVVPLSQEAEAEEKQKIPIALLPLGHDEAENYGSVPASPVEKEDIGVMPLPSINEAGEKKDKHAVHAGSSIVPVLRNEDPALSSSDDQSDDELDVDDPSVGKYRHSMPLSVNTVSNQETCEAYFGPSPSYTSELNTGDNALQPSAVQRGSVVLSASSSSGSNLLEKPDTVPRGVVPDAANGDTSADTASTEPSKPPSDSEVPHYVP